MVGTGPTKTYRAYGALLGRAPSALDRSVKYSNIEQNYVKKSNISWKCNNNNNNNKMNRGQFRAHNFVGANKT